MSFGIAVVLTALVGVVVVGIGVASIFARLAAFGLGVGLMLIGYGAVTLAIAWFAYRRHAFAWGLVVAVALLNALVAGNLIVGGDLPQQIGAGLALLVLLATIVAGVMPATRRAMMSEPERQTP